MADRLLISQGAACQRLGLRDDGRNIRVTDDLPRPLPVLREEGEIVRKLLGSRFREILSDEL
jgi:hypothetical protein